MIEDLWDVLTNAERIPRWFLPISGELELGGRYQLEGNAGGVITACEPPLHFTVTWEFGRDVSWAEVRLERWSRLRAPRTHPHRARLGALGGVRARCGRRRLGVGCHGIGDPSRATGRAEAG